METKMTIGWYIQDILAYMIPAFFLWIPKSMIVEQNLGKKPFERLENRSLIRLRGHYKFVCDYKTCYQVIRIFKYLCRFFLLGWMINALILSRIYTDTYLFRRAMEIGQGIAGFISIDVASISSAFIIDKKNHREMKKESNEIQYRKDYTWARDAFEKTDNPKRKKKLLYQMERNIALLVDYNARMIENGKLDRADVLDQLFPHLEFIEQQFLKLGKIESKYEIRWYTQCLWCCINLPKQRFEEAKSLRNIDESKCWDRMVEEISVVSNELYDSIITATTVGYVSLPQRENMYAAYHLYLQMIQELHEMFPHEAYKKDHRSFEKDRELYADLLKYREEHRWNQNKNIKE